MAAPTLQAHTMRRGNETKLGCGGVPLAQFMVVSDGGSAITSWAYTQTSGTTGHWTLTTTSAGTSPRPSSAGVTAALNGGPYVWNVTATNADGTSAAAVLTINIAANTITVATKDEISGTGATGLRYPDTLLNLGGKTVEVARGSYAAFNGNGGTTYNTSSFSPSIQKANTHTGRFSITSEDRTPGNRSKLGRLTLGGVQRMDMFDLDFEGYLLPQSGSSSNQGTAMLAVQYVDAGTGMCDDLTFDGLHFEAPEGTTPNQWRSAMQILGHAVSPFEAQTNIVITNCTATRVLDGLVIATSNDITVGTADEPGFDVDSFCSNAIYVSGYSCSRVVITDSVVVRPFHNTASPTDHRDAFQFGQRINPGANYNDNGLDRCFFVMADGDTACQGAPYCDDVASSGGVTGWTQNNFTMRHVFTDALAVQGSRIDGGSGLDVRYLTQVRGQCSAEANASSGAGVPTLTLSSAVPVSGIMQKCIVNNRNAATVSYLPDFDTDNTVSAQKATPPPSVAWSEAARVAYLAGTFQEPGRVIDYANLTAREIAAEVAIAYRPLLLGFARNADGTYDGYWFPDGSLNDGSVYEATPPTEYALTTPSITTEVGVAVTFTVQLDAPANVDVEFTPDVDGVTGTFSPATLTIVAAAASGDFTFTPTSPGTAEISTTNDGALPDPAPVSLEVTSPAVEPTTFTQSAPSAFVGLGASIPITYELDEPAVAPVTITPASNPAGVFTPTSVVILTGQSVGQVAFVPSVAGSSSLTATDDQELTDPEPLLLTVTTSTRGQLIALGIR